MGKIKSISRAHSISDGSGIRNLGLGFLEVLWRNGFLRKAELGFSSFLANFWPCLVIFQSGESAESAGILRKIMN